MRSSHTYSFAGAVLTIALLAACSSTPDTPEMIAERQRTVAEYASKVAESQEKLYNFTVDVPNPNRFSVRIEVSGNGISLHEKNKGFIFKESSPEHIDVTQEMNDLVGKLVVKSKLFAIVAPKGAPEDFVLYVNLLSFDTPSNENGFYLKTGWKLVRSSDGFICYEKVLENHFVGGEQTSMALFWGTSVMERRNNIRTAIAEMGALDLSK